MKMQKKKKNVIMFLHKTVLKNHQKHLNNEAAFNSKRLNESVLLFDLNKSIYEFCIKYYLSRFSGKSFCSEKS